MKSHKNYKKYFIKLLKTGTDEELSLFLSNVDAKKILAFPLTNRGKTALHICAEDNPVRIPYLLSLGADVKIKDKSGRDALQILLQKKFSIKEYGDVAMLLAQHGADINARGYKGRTLLHYVARSEGNKFNDTPFYGIKELLGMGADASIKDTSGYNALRWYTNSRSRPLTFTDSYFVKALLFIKQGADPNTTNKNGETLLHEAVVLKQQYIPELLESGVNPNIKVKLKVKSENNLEAEWDYTPLSLLIENKQGFDFKYAMKLVRHGADPNAQDFYRRTLLLFVAKSKPNLIPELITYGAKANNGDIWRADELKALMDNEKFNFKHAILVIMNGADPIVANQHNKTLLHLAAEYRSRYIPLLLHFGVDPDAQDDTGITAFQILMSKNVLNKTDLDGALALIQYSKKNINSTLGEKLLKNIYKKYPKIKNYFTAFGVPDHEMKNINYFISHINIASLRLEIKYQSRPQVQQERSQYLNALLILANDFFNKKSDSYFKQLPYEVITYIISMLPNHSSEITPAEIYYLGDHIFSNLDEARKMMKIPGGFNVYEQKDDTGKPTFRFFKSAQTFAQQFEENSQKYQGSKQKLKKDTLKNAIKSWDSHSSLFIGQGKLTLLESIKSTRLYQDEKTQAKLKI